MAEEQKDSVIDQGPRREEPAHKAPEPNRGGLLSRRGLLETAAKLGAGFGVGVLAGKANAEQAPVPQRETVNKPPVIKELLGVVNDISEGTLINTQRAQRIAREGSVTLEPSTEQPLLFSDPEYPTTVTKVMGTAPEPQTDGQPPNQRVNVLSTRSPMDTEGTTIYEVLLPPETDNCATWVNLKDGDTCYVIGQGPDPLDCTLSLDTDRSWPDMGEGSIYKVDVQGRDEFPAGSSYYLMINAKKPEQGTV